MRATPRSAWALLLLPLPFLALFFAFPLWRTLEVAFAGAAPWRWAAGDYVQARLRIAFVQALLSVALTLAIAIPLAWHHHTRAIPFSRVHLAVHAAPFVLPVFVVVHGMRELFGPRGWLHAATGVDLLTFLGPLGAVVLAHAYYNYGFAARLLHAALERRPHRLEEAAQALGASPRAALWRTTVPLLAPSIAAVALLVFLFCFTSFGVVLLLGGGMVATLETMLYAETVGIHPRLGHAAVLGVIQLALNVLLLWGYVALRRRETRLPRDPPRAPLPARARDRIVAAVALWAGLLPAATVLVGGFRVRGEWTLEAWRALLDPSHAGHVAGFHLGAAVSRSLLYAASSASLSLLLAGLLGYGLQRTGRLRRAVEVFAALPLGTSSVLIGLGYSLAFGTGAFLDLRGRLVLIVLAHTLVSFPFVARALLPALDAHDRRLDEAAALLGAGPAAVARRVHWPLLQGAVVAAAGFAVAISLGDFGASLLLMRTDIMGVSVWIAEIDRPFDGLRNAQSVALSAVLMVMAAVSYVAVEGFRRIGGVRF